MGVKTYVYNRTVMSPMINEIRQLVSPFVCNYFTFIGIHSQSLLVLISLEQSLPHRALSSLASPGSPASSAPFGEPLTTAPSCPS